MYSLSRLCTAALIAVLVLALPSVASAAVTPTLYAGNPGCADLNAGWSEFKLDRGNIEAGTYSNGDITVTITEVGGRQAFDWSSTQALDAVLVKGGTDTNAYLYDPESFGDQGLVPPDSGVTSHVAFCYDAGNPPPPPPPPCDEETNGGDDCNPPPPPPPCDEETNGGDDCNPPPPPPPCDEETNGGDDCNPPPPPPPAPEPQPQPEPEPQPEPQPAPEQQAAPEPQPEQQAAPETGEQVVLGEQIASPLARLSAPSGCVGKVFTAVVRGRNISRVVFRIDGRVVAVKRGTTVRLRVNPNKMSVGVHRLVATVRFADGTSRRLVRSFQRCARQLAAPRFTG